MYAINPRSGRAIRPGYFIKVAAISGFILFLIMAFGPRRVARADGGQQSQAPARVAPTKAELASGLSHFSAHCASCHGAAGKADTEKGRAVRASDLTSDKVQSKTDDALFRIISGGVSGTGMPAFGKSHSSAEINQIISFLRKLPSLTADERKELEAAAPAGAQHQHDEHSHHEQGHQHDHAAAQPASKPAAGKADEAAPHKHDAGGAHAGHDMSAMMSTITGGPFKAMQAIGSGTSLLPASSPGYMWHWMKGDWMIMAHGDLKVGVNHQGGPRGVTKAESQNWLMLMAERQAGRGRLMLRGMVSAEPWTAPRGGFPELFQTGETFEGRPIIDAQHAHDLFMELAAGYTAPLSENVSIHLYGGPVGEPALGPVAFMHRLSAAENPAAPLGHHWMDSTHIAHGVFTTGVTAGKFRLEGSIFRGAEPDEDRETIDLGKLDSYSGRLWFTPTPNWTAQVSYGYLTNPEALEPGDLKRWTASIHHNRSWADGYWASSLIWGRNSEEHGKSNAYLLESTVNFLGKNYFYTRMELGDRIGLEQENVFGRAGLADDHHDDDHQHDGDDSGADDHVDRWYRVAAFTFGGVRDFVTTPKLRVGLGADVTVYRVPDALKPLYGASPKSFHLFLRIRPGRM
jgi:mono/diheme cytochrome c family protein